MFFYGWPTAGSKWRAKTRFCFGSKINQGRQRRFHVFDRQPDATRLRSEIFEMSDFGFFRFCLWLKQRANKDTDMAYL